MLALHLEGSNPDAQITLPMATDLPPHVAVPLLMSYVSHGVVSCPKTVAARNGATRATVAVDLACRSRAVQPGWGVPAAAPGARHRESALGRRGHRAVVVGENNGRTLWWGIANG